MKKTKNSKKIVLKIAMSMTHPQRLPVPSVGLQPSNGQRVYQSLQPRNGTSEDPSLSRDPLSPDSLEDS